MTPSDIITICVTVLILAALILASYCLGRQAGYWKRVDEEKTARGIR